MKHLTIVLLSLLITTSGFGQKMIHELPRKTNVPDSTWLMMVGNPTAGTLYKMSVDNFRDSVLSIATLGSTLDTTSLSNRINLKANIASPTFTGTVAGITASMVGLGNVTNTSDANKQVSTAQQTALDLKANIASPTFTGTVELPSTTSIGTVSSAEIGYVDGATSNLQTQINSINPLPVTVSFTDTIPFTRLRTVMAKEVMGPIAFVPDSLTAIAGCETLLRIVSNGVDIPSFAKFKKLVASDDYNNVEGRVHLISFIYNGVDFNYSISQSHTISDYDAEALNFLIAASISDTTQRNAINQLVVDLKAASIWTKIKALYPLVGGTGSKHKFNLKDPQDLDASYRLSFSGTWTHNSDGAASNGSTAYANTHFDPTTDFTNGNISIGLYSKGSGGSGTAIGSDDGSGRTAVGIGTTVHGAYYSNSTGNDYSTYTTANSLGLMMGGINSNTLNFYKNGSSVTADAGTNSYGSAFPSRDIYIGALNQSGTAGDFATITYAMVILADHLTAGEQSDLYDAVLAFETTLGRN